MKYISTVAFAVLLFLLTSCRVDVAEKIDPSFAESFSPGYVKTGDTVSVLGVNLRGSSVKVGGVSVDLVEESDLEVKFVVSDDIPADTDSDATNNIEIEFSNGETHVFQFPLIVNYLIGASDKASWLAGSPQLAGEILQGPNQLLISDFDDAGIRNAYRTDRFDRIRFEATIREGGSSSVGSEPGLNNSPAQGDYLIYKIEAENGAGEFGFLGEIDTDSDFRNDGAEWSKNFSDYPNSPIVPPTDPSDLGEIYLNFCLFLNGKEQGLVDPTLYNDFLVGSQRYRSNRVRGSGSEPTGIGLNEWTWVSIPLTEFGSNFGGTAPTNLITPEVYSTINKIKFAYTYFDKKDDQAVPVTEDSEVYIDHIIITQGAPFFGHININ